MNLDKSKWKIKTSLLVLGIVILLGAGVAQAAPLGFWDKVAQLVAQQLSGKVEAPTQSVKETTQETNLGSAQTSPVNLVDTGTLNNQGSLYLWDTQNGGGLEIAGNTFSKGNLSVSGTLYQSGTSTLGNISSLDVPGTFADATTTLACVSNPFGATSTVRFIATTETGISTTSFAMIVATSTQTTGLTTSTAGFGISSIAQMLNINLVNNKSVTGTRFMSSATTDTRTGQGTQTAGSIQVTAAESVCFVAGEGNGGSVAGITGTNNLFAGTYDVEFKR